jgi:hypothetical protein
LGTLNGVAITLGLVLSFFLADTFGIYN